MSREYDLYLHEHRTNVATGYQWIRRNLPELVNGWENQGLEHQVCFGHDYSKNDPEEYNAYDRYFYGGNRSYAVVQDFNYAWLRHIHKNPHHWQYWVLHNDDPGEGMIVMDMPYNYIIEMICDWLSFSIGKGDLREVFKWYDEHKDYMKLSEKTRKTVFDILTAIDNKLCELDAAGKKEDINDGK